MKYEGYLILRALGHFGEPFNMNCDFHWAIECLEREVEQGNGAQVDLGIQMRYILPILHSETFYDQAKLTFETRRWNERLAEFALARNKSAEWEKTFRHNYDLVISSLSIEELRSFSDRYLRLVDIGIPCDEPQDLYKSFYRIFKWQKIRGNQLSED